MNPGASQRVIRCFAAGWSPVAKGLAAVSWWSMPWTRQGKPYHYIDVVAGHRKVQVVISPTGRSVRVFVDDEEVDRDGASVPRGV